MMELIDKLPQWVQDIPTYLGVLVVIATALVRIPALAHYEDEVQGVVKVITKILAWLPTIGKNPSTKALESKLKK